MGAVSSKITKTDLYQIFLDPICSTLGYANFDKSYGRRAIKYKIPQRLLVFSLEYNYCFDNNKKLIHFITVFDPNNPIIGDVVRVHGMGDYSGRFLKFAHFYVEKGFRLHLMDLPGHGHSDGVHCYFDVDECAEALNSVVKYSKSKYKIKNMFLKGGSLGGMVVLNYSLKYENNKKESDVRGIILHCPCVKVNDKAKPHKIIITIGKLFNIIIPRLPAIPRLKNMCSLDPEIDNQFLSDPLTYHWGLRIGSGFSLENTAAYFSKQLKTLKMPFLVQQGDADRMVDPFGAQMLIDMAISADKSIIMYKDCEHDMYTEKCAKNVFRDSIDWLLKRTT